ncbi:MAG TPA: amylo-alpha-1,6-glucosidase [Candidatus Binatia bacterium]|jgi:glycogen debranching enzyme|nr:amylo-alpha-1,6-glucosidase [Candidatus Binatia bacterium]
METSERIRILREELDAMRDPKLGYVRASLPRFDRLFGRDSLIVSWQRLEQEPSIAMATLRLLAKMQATATDPEHEAEPGKIVHEWAPERVPWVRWSFPYYGSVDATPLFVIVAAWTSKRLGDGTLEDELWPNVKAALAWVAKTMDADPRGFLTYDPAAKVTLLHQGWKDSGNLGPKPPVAIVEAQGYAYSAFLHAAAWADRLDPALAADWRARAARLKEAFVREFWLPGARYFALAIERDGMPYRAVASNPGHLLFTGILDDDQAAAVVERLFKEDLWTPYGIRTLSDRERDFSAFAYHKGSIWPHDNWVISEGLRVLGYEKERVRIKDALCAVHDGLGKLPELYACHLRQLETIKGAQHPQAWATCGLLNMLDSSLDPASALPLLPPR